MEDKQLLFACRVAGGLALRGEYRCKVAQGAMFVRFGAGPCGCCSEFPAEPSYAAVLCLDVGEAALPGVGSPARVEE